MRGTPAGRFVNRLRSLAAPFRARVLRMLIRTGQRARIHGIEVIDISREGAAGSSFTKIGEAVNLMIAHDLPSLERVRRDLDQIIVFTGTGAQYIPELNACFLDAGYVARQPPARIAMSLVHEATHAQLFRQGLRYEPGVRAGIEEMCVQAEIGFAEKVPGTQDLIAQARQHLTNPWWTDAELFKRRVERLRASGWPAWLVRWYERAFRPPVGSS